MQINLEKRKNVSNENVVYLDVFISHDKSQVLVGCINHGYHAYDIVDGKYKYAKKINLYSLHEGSAFHYAKVEFDENEDVFSFFNNREELLFTFCKNTETISFQDFIINDVPSFSLNILEGHHQYFDFYGIVEENEDLIYFKLDDVVYQLIKNNNHYDYLFPNHSNDEHIDYESNLYDNAWIIKAENPPLDKFPKDAIDMVQIKRMEDYSDGQTISGTEIYSKKKDHSYIFAGKLNYDGEDSSTACYVCDSEIEKKKKENPYPISDSTWNYMTDFSYTSIGMKEGSANGSAWINSIIERLNAIEDDEEAILKMFALQQKIGIAKANKSSYYYGEKYSIKLYKNLEKTLNILLKERLKK